MLYYFFVILVNFLSFFDGLTFVDIALIKIFKPLIWRVKRKVDRKKKNLIKYNHTLPIFCPLSRHFSLIIHKLKMNSSQKVHL